jgi:hypothetical protein
MESREIIFVDVASGIREIMESREIIFVDVASGIREIMGNCVTIFADVVTARPCGHRASRRTRPGAGSGTRAVRHRNKEKNRA